MINKILQIVAPHYCYGCGKIGTLLCSNCKYDITDDGFSACIVCARPSAVGICPDCHTSYEKAWCLGERTGVLQRVIDGLKFDRQVDAAESLASLLDTHLPVLPTNTIIVPVPTISAHVRQRGYDQTRVVAKHLSRMRGLRCVDALERRDTRSQRGHSKAERFNQAEAAFVVAGSLDAEVPYILLDDIVTTNATVRFAAQALRDAGARTVWVAVLARQPLDKPA
jgi:ComF family protein